MLVAPRDGAENMINTSSDAAVSTKTIEAFHTMWGNFPHGVLLLKSDREIVATNEVSKQMGAIEGRKCFQLGGLSDIHKGCLGNCALEEEVTQRRTYRDPSGKIVDSYWLPVPSDEDLMIHFAVYIDPPADD